VKSSLRRVLEESGPLLLDFDGPVCSIFANYTAASASSELRDILLAFGVSLPDPITDESDPLEILRWTASIESPALTHAVEDALRAAEVRAVKTATPTPGVRELLSAFRERARPIAIVSNNSSPAIAAYVDSHGLAEYVTSIVGREPYKPDRMKPNPEPLIQAAAALSAQPETCVLIGDSLSDITAAQAAGIPVIAYANKPAKKGLFAAAGAGAVVTSIADVVAALPAR
jgi:HAD superfamily hydrolase (TIGR01509 family)